MALNGISPALAIRSSVGIELWSSAENKDKFVPHPDFTPDWSKFCRAIVFSPDGRYVAWANDTNVQICSSNGWKLLCSLPRSKTFYLKFSPTGDYLTTWELFTTTKEKPEGSPNLYVFRTETGEEVFSIVQKKNSDWEPSWSNDDSIFALMVGGEALFYETNGADGFKKTTKKIGGGRNGALSLAPNKNTPFVTFYTPGVKGAPSMCKIFKYPELQTAQPIGCKSFFQADRVELNWNQRGTGVLLLTSTDVDQTGASYYGKQALHFMSTKGDSFAVQLNKDGPVHAVSWNPNSTEFCVIYGFMPAKASFFNMKCDAIHEVSDGARNSIYYNSFGNLVLLAGFGNLSGSVEVWDVAKKKLLTTLQAPDTTLLEWCPNGETFLTATTAPRLRMSNGFKVWHYSGALLHEILWPVGQELLEVVWQKYPDGTFQEKPISNVKVVGIKSSVPTASAQAYRPPNVRGIVLTPKPGNATTKPTNGHGTEGDKAQTPSTPNMSRKQRRVRDFQNRRTPGGAPKDGDKPNGRAEWHSSPQLIAKDARITEPATEPAVTTTSKLTPAQEKAKLVSNIKKKLHDIAKLKVRKEKGEHLEINQVKKIKGEPDLVKKLTELML